MGGTQWICVYCGKGFDGRKKKYCSLKCRNKAYRQTYRPKRHLRHCVVCSNDFLAGKKDAQYCSQSCINKSRDMKRPMSCLGCSIRFMPKATNRIGYCSRECAFAVKTKISKERMWMARMAHDANKRIRKERLVDCPICNKGFIIENRSGCNARSYCSIKCYNEVKNVRKKRWFVCKRCGKPRTKHANKWCKDCRIFMKRASRIQQRIKRKYQIKESEMQLISDTEQFIHDNWKCQICGCYVDQIPPYNKPNYANMDHIVPLSKGGKHILSNVQTLCARCNEKKSNKEQTSELMKKIRNDYKEKDHAA